MADLPVRASYTTPSRCGKSTRQMVPVGSDEVVARIVLRHVELTLGSGRVFVGGDVGPLHAGGFVVEPREQRIDIRFSITILRTVSRSEFVAVVAGQSLAHLRRIQAGVTAVGRERFGELTHRVHHHAIFGERLRLRVDAIEIGLDLHLLAVANGNQRLPRLRRQQFVCRVTNHPASGEQCNCQR